MKCEFILLFDNYHFYPYVTSKLSDNKTMVCWKTSLEKVIGDFKVEGYTFNHIAEMHIVTIASKTGLLYDFYIKHNICALEWK